MDKKVYNKLYVFRDVKAMRRFSFNLLATEKAQTTIRCGHQALFINVI